MNVRAKIAELTQGCKSQIDLDAVVSRHGGLPKLFAEQFPGVARDEFSYEWDSMKLGFRGRMTEED